MADGWTNRIKLGLSRILSVQPEPLSHGTKTHYTSNIDVNAIQYAMGNSGFSQPVWGPEISTVGAYSREGYTSRTFDTPTTPFSDQVYYVRRDEDVQLALNHLTSQITGGAHYWKSEYQSIQDAMTQFSEDIDFDWIDTIIVKELLAYGNTVWKPRLGITNIRNRDDLLHIPISSFVRIWWDRARRPYKFEFRGSEYQGYHNTEDIVHLSWNPINGSLFGTGFMDALVSTRDFTELTPTGERSKRLPSLMDRKYSTAMTMHLTEKRYVPHNVYVAANASADERAQLSADVADIETGEDLVVGNKVEVQELGSNSKAFNPTQFNDLTQGGIFKALNDFTGKQGSEESHQYANAAESSNLTEIGLSSFPLAVTRQIMEKLFQPYYESTGGITDLMYGGGILPVPWKEANPELNFGHVQKKDLETKDMITLIQLAAQTGAVQNPVELRKLLEDAGLGLTEEMTTQMDQQYNNPNIYPPNFDTYAADQAPRSQDDPNYTSSQRDFVPEPIQSIDASPSQTHNANPQPSYAGLNFTDGTGGSHQVSVKLPDKLEIEDVNAFLAESEPEKTTLDKEEQEARIESIKLKNKTRETILNKIAELDEEMK